MVTTPGPDPKIVWFGEAYLGTRGDAGSTPASASKNDSILSKDSKIMKRKSVQLTLLNARITRTNEARAVILLTGIHELLYAIAEELGVFEDEDEDKDEIAP